MTVRRSLPWLGDEREAWLVEILAWTSHQLGPVRGHDVLFERPWGAVLRVTSNGGTSYLKACGLGAGHEPALLGHLQGRAPGLVPVVIATDVRHGWILMEDHGIDIHGLGDVRDQLDLIERLLPAYADLQRTTGADVPAMLAFGVPDRRPAALPSLLEELCDRTTLAGWRPSPDVSVRFADACARLAAGGVPAALDHGDLHTKNVLVRDGEPHVIDWGDASITYPSTSLFVVIHLVVSRLPRTDRVAAARRLRDAYLNGWGAAGSDLRADFTVAMWVAHVIRALDFAHMTEDAPAAIAAEWDGHVAAVLRRWAALAPHVDGDDTLLGEIEP